MPTKAGLAQELAIEAGELYGDVDIATQFEAWVQQAVDAVYAVSPWFFRNDTDDVVTADTVAEYTMGSGVALVRDAVVTAVPSGQESVLGRHIVYSPVERLIAHSKSLSAAGAPQYWYFSGVGSGQELKISLQPVPNGIFTVQFHVLLRPSDLSSGDDIPLPKEYINAVRDKVRSLQAFSDGDKEGAMLFTQMFHEQLQLLRTQYHGLDRGPSRMRVKGAKAEYQSPTTPGGG